MDQNFTFLQELEPVIELLREGKQYGARCLCDTIDQRYQYAKDLNEQCRALLSDIEEGLSGSSELAVDEISTRYEKLATSR